ncbi:DNA repair protein RAD5A-like, partial [Neltuma alba]|uniref:DNA repair protein RAD5A-like n=1 Tax=Neltuma alba TaxID=207710 RepID=UPI0010A598C4
MRNNKVVDQQLSTVRSIVGAEYSDMDIIRALHMANNDLTAAINIIFDTPKFKLKERLSVGTQRNSQVSHRSSSSDAGIGGGSVTVKSKPTASEDNNRSLGSEANVADSVSNSGDCTAEDVGGPSSSAASDWWFVGCGEMAGLSTSKGRSMNPGDQVLFKFPLKIGSTTPSPGKGFGRGRPAATACSEIVRFYTKETGEIGRIPNEWARCLLPLVRDKKVRIDGHCKHAPNNLSIMDTIILSIRVFINSSMFRKRHQVSLKDATNSTDESVFHPLPTLFRLLGLSPFKKAEFTPGDLYSKKRPFNEKEDSSLQATLLHIKSNRPSVNDNEVDSEKSISDTDLDKIVGVGACSELEEMDPPGSLQCELRPYQKQALHWMIQLEKGRPMDEAATTLHPCWEAYRLADERELVIYLNVFSGEATIEFPSTLQMARGGILADAMGLGKTIMTIALLVAHSGTGGSSSSQLMDQPLSESEVNDMVQNSSNVPKKANKFSSFDKLRKQRNALTNGGSLIICPMTLLGQWKAEIETHVQTGSLSLYVHYGQSRPKDAKTLAQSDVVITTYGIVASEFSGENAEDNGGLFSIRWFRVVLDEAHTIKSSKSQISMATSALIADRRWCLTGTPIQNNLEDVYSLLRFLRIEPWGHWAWWNKLVQKPFEEGDERGLKLVQSILKPIMLRRTKHSMDRDGKPIIVLPPAEVQIIYCELTEAEKDFYEALFKRSKVKFDQFVEQGRILHNYASILELLLRLRQCCDHPFLVM